MFWWTHLISICRVFDKIVTDAEWYMLLGTQADPFLDEILPMLRIEETKVGHGPRGHHSVPDKSCKLLFQRFHHLSPANLQTNKHKHLGHNVKTNLRWLITFKLATSVLFSKLKISQDLDF